MMFDGCTRQRHHISAFAVFDMNAAVPYVFIVDDIITGTEEEIEQHVHFGYAVPTEEAPVIEEVVEEQPAEEPAEEEAKKGKK